MDFSLWKDYLGLAHLIEAMKRESHEGALVITPENEETDPPEAEPPNSEGPEASASECNFCKHNGESKRIYSTHPLKDLQGRVQCPILRQYVCPQCQASGDTAHTLRFCPRTRKDYCSVYQCTARNAAGRRGRRPDSHFP
ncbi:nanos homolog 3-like [Ambystoma mexicanum]|uniref:nanos homolog 3-like n=1 Tax=Ambystoma mexicanum TaxID=8296 RepID=UPI0037E7FAE6